MSAIYSGAPYHPVPTGASIAAGAERVFTSYDVNGREMIRHLWCIQNHSTSVDIAVGFQDTTAVSGASTLHNWADVIISAGETRSYEIDCSKIVVRNLDGANPILTQDSGAAAYDKELFITCLERE